MSDTTQAGTQTVEELEVTPEERAALERVVSCYNNYMSAPWFEPAVRELIIAVRTAERARVESEYREQLEQAKHEHRRNLADCVQHAECGWQWREKLQRDLNCERDALLCIFSTVIATPERGYTGEPEMLLSDARQVCRELKRAQSELTTLRARLPLLVKIAAREQRDLLTRWSLDGTGDNDGTAPYPHTDGVITEWLTTTTPATQETQETSTL